MKGTVTIPGSKSHTIRSVYIASLADGHSVIRAPLLSQDTEAAICVCRAFGAEIVKVNNQLEVTGFGGKPSTPEDVIDVGNSGTTLRLGVSTAALNEGYSLFTGDEQIRSRPMEPLLTALNNLGARAISTRGNGKAPLIVKGRARGGKTELKAVSGEVYLNGDPEHAGFQYRPHNEVATGPASDKAKYLFHQDNIDPKKDKDLPWVVLEYGLNGKKYNVQYMSHPTNPNSDAVFSAYRDYGRFGEFFKERIPTGKTLKLRYRLQISKGKMPAREKADNLYQTYIKR